MFSETSVAEALHGALVGAVSVLVSLSSRKEHSDPVETQLRPRESDHRCGEVEKPPFSLGSLFLNTEH